jgi:hypothetical protein
MIAGTEHTYLGCPQYQCADKGDEDPLTGRTCIRLADKTAEHLEKHKPAKIQEDENIGIIQQLGLKTCVVGRNLFADGHFIKTSGGCAGMFL